MNLKAQAAFTSVTDKKTKAISLDGGLEITGEIIPDTPLQHEMLVATLGGDKEPSCEVTFDVEKVTEKITFKVRFEKDVLEAAHARLKVREEANDEGLPIHIHEENLAEEAKAPKAAKE